LDAILLSEKVVFLAQSMFCTPYSRILGHSIYKVIINVMPAYVYILGQYSWLDLIFKSVLNSFSESY